jgi:hypothetical protein
MVVVIAVVVVVTNGAKNNFKNIWLIKRAF